MTKLETQIHQFANLHFTRAIHARVKKTGEEYSELVEAAIRGDTMDMLKEAADMVIVLTDLAALIAPAGSQLRSLTEIVRQKFAINQARMKERQLRGLPTRNVSKLSFDMHKIDSHLPGVRPKATTATAGRGTSKHRRNGGKR